MKIHFDHQAFSMQTFGGISRYYAELISGINQTDDANQAYLSLIFSNNLHLCEANIYAKPFFSNQKFPKKAALLYWINQEYSIFKMNQKPFDVFHATYYDPYFIPHLKKRPLVVTFLDMIHEKFSGQFPELADDGLMTKQKQLLANRADRIIAISESTKRDIVNILGINPNKIDVIYLGSSLKQIVIQSALSKKQDFSPYLLFVGRRERYKNFERLLRSIHPLLKKYKLKLLCAGGDSFTHDERLFIRSIDAEEIVEYRAISSDEILSGLYQSALGFVFPSLYEGFGIPILEAFACNCPCVLSYSSSLPEIAGDAALYFDPTNQESIAYAVEQLVIDSELRMQLINKGKKKLTAFSWISTVNETLEVYGKCF